MVFPEMQGLAGIMLGDSTSFTNCTTTTGNFLRFDAMQPTKMYPVGPYSPSTIKAMENRIKNLERKEKMRKVLPPATMPRAHMETPIEFKARKMNMVKPGYDPYHPDEPDEFTQLSNHDFHKLLANFEALLEN